MIEEDTEPNEPTGDSNRLSCEHTLSTLCETSKRCQLQYRFVNLLDSDLNKFPKSISTIILKPHGRPFEKIRVENEAFAL